MTRDYVGSGSRDGACSEPGHLRPSITRTEVVDLRPDDVAELHDLRTRAADFFSEVGDEPPTPESLQDDLDDLPEGYSRADEVMYRAYRDGELQGYAEVLRGFEPPDQWMIGIVLVDPAARGSGIGRAVVDAIASDALAAGAGSLAAGVIALRERSLAFWRREGFTREVRRRPITIGGVATEVVRLERALRQAADDSMTLDDYFHGRSESRVIFGALHRLADSLGSTELRVTRSQVAFCRRRAWAWAWASMPQMYLKGRGAPLVLTLALSSRDPSPRWKEIVEPSPGQFTHHLELYSASDVDDEVGGWLRQAWERAG